MLDGKFLQQQHACQNIVQDDCLGFIIFSGPLLRLLWSFEEYYYVYVPKQSSNLWKKVCIEGKQGTILFVIVASFSLKCECTCLYRCELVSSECC